MATSTNPRAYPNSLVARIDALERALGKVQGVSLGKLKTVSASNEQQGFSYTGSALQLGAVIVVPPLATTVSLIAVATAVYASNAAAAAAISTYLWCDCPELGAVQSSGANAVVQSNQQASRSRGWSLAAVPIPTGVTALTVRCNASASNTGTNSDNYMGINAIAFFQY